MKFISKEEKTDTISILNSKQKDNFFCVLYSNGEKVCLMVLEKGNQLLFPNRYGYLCGLSTSSGGAVPSSDSKNTLTVIFGDNNKLQAASYEFSNGGRQYKNTNLDMYLLDIYIFYETDDVNSPGRFLDENGNEICQF